MGKVIALLGNPNCGKTTLFNALTGTYQKTGNWSGVTTEKKEGKYRKNKNVSLVDLPGIYSLSANSDDERAVLNFLKKSPPDVIVNVLDGTNLERNLYLTLELSTLKIPVIIAVNMYDDLKKNGIAVDFSKFSKIFGVPVLPISALKGYNIDELIDHAVQAKTALKTPNIAPNGDLATVERRYEFIEKCIEGVIIKKQTKGERVTQIIDGVIMHKIFGIPIFFCVVTLMYFLSIKIGGALGRVILGFFSNLSNGVNGFFVDNGVPEWIRGLTSEAIIDGVGTVFSFFPQILVLFAIMTVIEESGYSSRVAFLLDKFFRFFGLGGKSIIPLIVSCGCNVSGIMATRTIDNASEKRMTLFLSPFMPCGAKMAVFGWFSFEFFGGSALVATSMYFLSIFSVAVFGALLKNFKSFRIGSGVFILEIPTLRAPSLKDVALVLWEKSKDFITKAGMIVFLVSVVLWALKNLGFSGYVFGQVEKSFLYELGNLLKFIFYPLGFGNWQSSVAVISGLMAKEAVVETLSLLSKNPLSLFYNYFSIYAFMAFVLLSPPCIASIATAKRELKSKKWLAFMLLFQFFAAYSVALFINFIGILLEHDFGLILSILTVIIVTIISATFIKKIKSRKCSFCGACKKGRAKCQRKNQFTIE